MLSMLRLTFTRITLLKLYTRNTSGSAMEKLKIERKISIKDWYSPLNTSQINQYVCCFNYNGLLRINPALGDAMCRNYD